jgi:hypothetical protein
VVKKVRERLAVSKQTTQVSYENVQSREMKRSLAKSGSIGFKSQAHSQTWKTQMLRWILIHITSETIGENKIISARASPGDYELKKHYS